MHTWHNAHQTGICACIFKHKSGYSLCTVFAAYVRTITISIVCHQHCTLILYNNIARGRASTWGERGWASIELLIAKSLGAQPPRSCKQFRFNDVSNLWPHHNTKLFNHKQCKKTGLNYFCTPPPPSNTLMDSPTYNTLSSHLQLNLEFLTPKSDWHDQNWTV